MNKSYPKYKLSGVEWLGDVPEHWDVKAIKWMTPVLRGASPRPIDDPIYFDDEGEYAWVRISDVTASKTFLEVTTQRLSHVGSSFSVKMKPGDLFVSIAGTVGVPCITKIKCCIHDGFIYFPRLKSDTKFMYYIFACGEPYKGLGKMGTQLNLNTDTVASIVMGFPPLPEQQAIAAFLDRETSHIDLLIEKKQQLLKLLQEKRSALITRAVTKGLDPTVKMKPSGVEWLGDVPEHWEVKKLRFICSIETGDKDTIDAEDDGEYPFYVRSQTVERINSFTKQCEGVLTAGDGVGVGKVFHYVNGKFDFHQRVYLFSNFKKIKGKFFFLYFRELFGRIAFDGSAKSTVDSLRRPMLSNFIFVVPSFSEQQAIASFLDRETKKIDMLSEKITKAIDTLQEYRTALISAAVTGKIDVR